MSASEKQFVDYVVDLMQSIGPVHAKHMFGGHGIFIDDLMFALVADSTLYLKVDAESEADFRARGLEAFSYEKKGRSVSMSYCQAPEEALEDSEEMNTWANKAYAAAWRAVAAKRKT